MAIVNLVTNKTAGPLVSGMTASNFTYYVSDPARMQQLVNKAVINAENGLPEGALVQLVISGLRAPVTGVSQASSMAETLQTQFDSGLLRDPVSGNPMQAWPSENGRIAWADDQTATITLRWVKADVFAWVIVGIVIAIAGIVIYNMLTKSPYQLGSVAAAATTGGTSIIGSSSSGMTLIGIPVWPWWVIIGVGVAATPAVYRWNADTKHEKARAIAATRELQQEEHTNG